MKFRVVIEYDEITKSYSAVCPELPGCATAGDTEREVRENIEEAIRLYLEPAEIEVSENAKLIEVYVGSAGDTPPNGRPGRRHIAETRIPVREGFG